MDVAEWQKRLEDTFSTDNIIGKRLMTIINMEKAYGQCVVQKFRGYRVLTDSFFDFYMETLQVASDWLQVHDISHDAPSYPTVFLLYVVNFRSLRAVENLFLCGYPIDGYALLRDVKDRAIFIGAIMNRLSSFNALYIGKRATGEGTEPFTRKEYEKIREQRKKEEHVVLNQMLRSKSGLSKEHVTEIRQWEQLFHEEVHGSRFTYFMEGGPWLKGERNLLLGPLPKDSTISMYINRSNEICWMLLRTLPFLQLKPGAFGKDWARKWVILDDSFRFAEESLGKMNKKIAWAVIELIEQKFRFSPEETYFEIG